MFPIPDPTSQTRRPRNGATRSYCHRLYLGAACMISSVSAPAESAGRMVSELKERWVRPLNVGSRELDGEPRTRRGDSVPEFEPDRPPSGVNPASAGLWNPAYESSSPEFRLSGSP